jgi:4'-phosphopantetheinyl transferase
VSATTTTWPWTRGAPALLDSEVHVWLVSLDRKADSLDDLRSMIGDDERERADRFFFRRDAARWIANRAVRREILGSYLGVAPRDVCFQVGPWGKAEPRSASPHGLRFNASYSDGLALYVVARDRHVGIDIERVRPLPDLEAIARRMFSADEQRAFLALVSSQRQEAFFACWTRKEAYIKALGQGLVYPLERFTVSLTPGVPARLEHVQGQPAELRRWSLETLVPAPGYVGALAIEGPPVRVRCARWQEPAC